MQDIELGLMVSEVSRDLQWNIDASTWKPRAASGLVHETSTHHKVVLNISPVDAAGGSTTALAANFGAPQAAQALLLNTAKLLLLQLPYLQPLGKPQPYFNVRNLTYANMNLQIDVQTPKPHRVHIYYKCWLQINNSNNVSLNN